MMVLALLPVAVLLLASSTSDQYLVSSSWLSTSTKSSPDRAETVLTLASTFRIPVATLAGACLPVSGTSLRRIFSYPPVSP